MKGGSWISTGNELMKHSRYAFRRHFYQHAGFRYVEDTSAHIEVMVTAENNIYETDSLVSQYCEFQYGQEYFKVKNFAVACAELAKKYALNMGSALDLGCATGRATFELARYFERVTGIDFSARFIQVGVELKASGVMRYQRVEEGQLISVQECNLANLGLSGTVDKVEFWQGDACNLKPKFTGYDVVIATNLIDRLYEPKIFLQDVSQRLNKDGLLLLTSPYTWLEEYTKPQHWLGGYADETGKEITTLQGVKNILCEQFELLETSDVEFVIRETSRKYQHSIAQVSVWRKK
jgi:putative 4-mercaptohistidine N1-methyltranferase